MTEQDYELLSQYVDHELSASEVYKLEQRLATEPTLRASLKRLQEVDESLKSAFSETGDSRVPAKVMAMLDNASARIVPISRMHRASWGFALAASLVVAITALLIPEWQRDSTPAGKPLADPMLARVLENVSSRGSGWDVLPDGREMRPVLSFQSNTGHWCREFLLSGGEADNGRNFRGVACRRDQGWVNEILVGEPSSGSSTDYRPAGAIDSDQIAEFISSHATDIALNPKQEAALIARQWR